MIPRNNETCIESVVQVGSQWHLISWCRWLDWLIPGVDWRTDFGFGQHSRNCRANSSIERDKRGIENTEIDWSMWCFHIKYSSTWSKLSVNNWSLCTTNRNTPKIDVWIKIRIAAAKWQHSPTNSLILSPPPPFTFESNPSSGHYHASYNDMNCEVHFEMDIFDRSSSGKIISGT